MSIRVRRRLFDPSEIRIPLVPASETRGYLVVSAYLTIENEKNIDITAKPLQFFVDTGATPTLGLFPKAAKELKLPIGEEVTIMAGKVRRLPTVDLHVPTLPDKEIRILNVEKGYILGADSRMIEDTSGLAGIIGLPAFMLGATHVDYDNNVLTLMANKPRLKRDMGNALKVPMSLWWNVMPAVSLELEDKAGQSAKIEAILDTGAETTFLSQRATQKLAINKRSSVLRSGTKGTKRVDLCEVSQMCVGAFVQEPATFTRKPNGESPPENGVGLNFLQHFNILIDVRGKELWLQPRKEAKGITVSESSSQKR
ncbi:MAG: hypothetical protein OHK0029_41160 [Armatimonadaceae bacterium]